MPRQARKKSSTGIYHVMFRGINGQVVFAEKEDYAKFLTILSKYQEVSGYELYAYCLLSNHLHLLIKEDSEDLGRAFRRIGASYVYWYNGKYKRRGHLFQDRYKSEAVEDEKYFLTVLRYIHQNPLKAGIASEIDEYPWSSYKEYLQGQGICNTQYVLKMFAADEVSALEQYQRFHEQDSDEQCLDYAETPRIDDREAAEIIMNIAGTENLQQLLGLKIEQKKQLIGELKSSGLSLRQIERLTGFNFSLIRKV